MRDRPEGVPLTVAAAQLGKSYWTTRDLLLRGRLRGWRDGNRYYVEADKEGRVSLLAEAIEQPAREAAVAELMGGPAVSPLRELVEDPGRFVREHLTREQQIQLARHLLYDEAVGAAMRKEIARRKSGKNETRPEA